MGFFSHASQQEKDVISGIQYYYECKKAATLSHVRDCDKFVPAQHHELRNEQAAIADDDEEEEDTLVKLTIDDLRAYEESQKSHREEAHGMNAVAVGLLTGIFPEKPNSWNIVASNVGIASGADYVQLQKWQTAMVDERNEEKDDVIPGPASDFGDVAMIDGLHEDDDEGHISYIQPSIQEHLSPVDPSCLLKDQRRAYDIINWHLSETLAGHKPPQLLMQIPGEGGVGKSKTIQTITENFRSQGVESILVKAAYTGIAASIIDGKTLHVIALIPLNGREQGVQTLKKLAAFWKDKQYLIIDEKSMLSRRFLAKISANVAKGKSLAGEEGNNQAFGGVNVIIIGDFHQFPPVAVKKSTALYYPCDSSKDTAEDMLGRKIYEQFTTIVRLKEQVRVTDPEWNELLHHVRHGSCRAHHIQLLHSLVLTNPHCPPTDFNSAPWNDAVLITPRNAVCCQWNSNMTKNHC